jgi:stage V sporulation protein S
MDIIKVAVTSRSTAVAGAIAGVMRERGYVDVQAIGAGAVNQAIKAVIIARGYLELDGIDVICIPSFTEVMIDDQERTAVRLRVEKRGASAASAPVTPTTPATPVAPTTPATPATPTTPATPATPITQ